MAATPYFQPKFESAHLAKKLANLPSDTLTVGLIASGTLAARNVTQGYEFVADLLANNGSALTEVSTSGTGYTRQSLPSVTYALSGLVMTLGAGNVTWNPATFTAVYGWVHDETASSGTDATRPLVCLWDFGGPQSVSAGIFTLVMPAAGLDTWTVTA